ncbi:MAG: hypothetical protein HY804_03970, partial [Nitrospinae bacterium]|nr:hypothetical protein [Nitrospinota bacterium]
MSQSNRLAWFTAAALLCATATGAAQAAWRVVENAPLGFRFEAPASWRDDPRRIAGNAVTALVDGGGKDASFIVEHFPSPPLGKPHLKQFMQARVKGDPLLKREISPAADIEGQWTAIGGEYEGAREGITY